MKKQGYGNGRPRDDYFALPHSSCVLSSFLFSCALVILCSPPNSMMTCYRDSIFLSVFCSNMRIIIIFFIGASHLSYFVHFVPLFLLLVARAIQYPSGLINGQVKKCSFRAFINNDDNTNFILPLSTEAADQYIEIQTILEGRDWDISIEDIWLYSWGNSKYSSQKAYKTMIGHQEVSPLFTWLWKSNNLGNHKFFFWHLLRDRLNTRNLLRRKNRNLDDYSCPLCSTGSEETCFHLFFECPFSQQCWTSIPIQWDLSLPPLDMIIAARSDFGSVIFREIFITACWIIWKTRNAVIFDNGQININRWKIQFHEELGLVCIKAKSTRANLLNSWRDSLLLSFALGLEAL